MIKNRFSILFVLVFSTTFSACKKEKESTSSLIKCWALYETVDDRSTFLNCDDESLGLNWYRQIYDLKRNNICIYSVLSPVDAHYTEEGTYEYSDYKRELTIYDKSGNILGHYKVISLETEELIMEKI